MSQLVKYLMALILLHSWSYAEATNRENSVIIQEAFDEAKSSVSLPRSIHLELLTDCPEMLPMLAQWQYDDWHSYDTSLTVDKLITYFEKQPIDGSFTLVAIKDGMPIGSISLDKEGEPEFSDLSGPWLNSFHVISSERGNGVGQGLAKVLLGIAKHLGYEQANFFTSNFSNVAKYVKKGAQVVDSRPYRGHTITLFKMSLAD